MKNRGDFTEEFSEKCLERVFGKNNVFTNVNIFDGKKTKAGEIDVLVLFADRAIVLQAKSKKLTLESRRGNDNSIKEDFKKSVQESYDQGLSCAKLLANKKYMFRDLNGKTIRIPKKIRETYILCVVSDHYPALSFQARQFLKFQQVDSVSTPFVMDVFLLDVLTEMLQTPLYFLSYINRRTHYSERIFAMHELTILSFHLKYNLWIDDSEYDFMHLDDDICADLDIAMMVRREGVQGQPTPIGILTKFKGTTLEKIIHQIENLEDPGTIDLGFMLLTINEETFAYISKGIDKISELARSDNRGHDLTVAIKDTGLTIHSNNDPMPVSGPRLQTHCERRKYTEKAKNWFGLCINPQNLSIRFGLELDYEWVASKQMDEVVKGMPRGVQNIDFSKAKKRNKKAGRNEPCPCGSGIKHKKCCLRK